MDRYKLLLVDDEEDARQAIASKLCWEQLGFELSGEAGNGEEALELCEILHPDVVMTDIQMPFMDGLTLCRRLKNLYPGIKVAIFSGFDEFEYAKKAISLEVEEYILKPINSDELAGVFTRIKNSLDTEREEKRNIEHLQTYYEQSRPLIHQQLLSALVESRIEADHISKTLLEYEFDLLADQYAVAVVHFDKTSSALSQSHLLSVSLSKIIEETLKDRIKYELIGYIDRFMLLFLLDKNVAASELVILLNRLFVPAKKLLNVRITVGLGNIYTSIPEIPVSYQEANYALDYQILLDSEQCVFMGDIEPETALHETVWDARQIDEVMREVKIGSHESLILAVYNLIMYLKKTRSNIAQYQIFFLEMSTDILKLFKSYNLDAKLADVEDILLERKISRFSSLEQLESWLCEYFHKIQILIRSKRKDSTRILVEEAEKYIREKYMDADLSEDIICQHLSVSPAYFSTIFKKETGRKFVSYLTAIRMEKAAELLQTTGEKTYIVAEKVGFRDPNYFSYAFKKFFSVSPSKYLNKNR